VNDFFDGKDSRHSTVGAGGFSWETMGYPPDPEPAVDPQVEAERAAIADASVEQMMRQYVPPAVGVDSMNHPKVAEAILRLAKAEFYSGEREPQEIVAQLHELYGPEAARRFIDETWEPAENGYQELETPEDYRNALDAEEDAILELQEQLEERVEADERARQEQAVAAQNEMIRSRVVEAAKANPALLKHGDALVKGVALAHQQVGLSTPEMVDRAIGTIHQQQEAIARASAAAQMQDISDLDAIREAGWLGGDGKPRVKTLEEKTAENLAPTYRSIVDEKGNPAIVEDNPLIPDLTSPEKAVHAEWKADEERTEEVQAEFDNLAYTATPKDVRVAVEGRRPLPTKPEADLSEFAESPQPEGAQSDAEKIGQEWRDSAAHEEGWQV